MKKFSKYQRGFTIIEVMIVLAIAGLILAIVFIAVPQLQRNARDNSRQNIVARVKSELETYSSNNQGNYPFNGTAGTPASWTDCSTANAVAQSCYDWYNRYLIGGNVKIDDPTKGTPMAIKYSNLTARDTWAIGDIWIHVGAKCSGGENVQAGTSAGTPASKQYAIIVALDRSNTFYCLDNG